MASRSPTAVTPLPKTAPSAPETPLKDTTTATTAPQTVPFPSPQTFDIIPPLHGLLLRLLAPQTNGEGTSSDARPGGDTTNPSGSSGAAQAQSQAQHQQSSGGNGSNGNGTGQAVPSSAPGAASLTAEIAALGSNAPPPLDIKDLPTEASSIKIRIQKAHNVVGGMPDIQRSVDEQEAEIEELEDRIARLQSVISDFGKRSHTENSKKSAMDES